MSEYPQVRADGAQIEVELDKGLTVVAHVGDSNVAAQLADLQSLKDSMAVRIARLEARLRTIGPIDIGDDELRHLLSGLRRQMDDFEHQSRLLEEVRQSQVH